MKRLPVTFSSPVMAAVAIHAQTSLPSPLVVDVWPGPAPDDKGLAEAERSYVAQTPFVGLTRLITNVTKPTLTIYRPPTDRNTGTAMIVLPGGGYRNLFWELEGEEVAAWLNAHGMTGIVLKYRVPFRPGETRPPPGPLQDAQRAISLVRSRAAEWGINPSRDRHCGFLCRRTSGCGRGHEFRETDLRGHRRGRSRECAARLRDWLLLRLLQGRGEG